MQDDVRKLKGRLFWSSVDALRGDYTWRDIADTCGTTESTLGMMRMRGVLPRADVVVAIAKFLHVTVEILMDEEDRGRVRPRQAQIGEMLDGLTDEQLEAVGALVGYWYVKKSAKI